MHLKFIAITIFILIMGQSCIASKKDQKEVLRKEPTKGDKLFICTDPRPQVCTMDYLPVCAQMADGGFKTYSNGCTACSDANVVAYGNGECE